MRRLIYILIIVVYGWHTAVAGEGYNTGYNIRKDDRYLDHIKRIEASYKGQPLEIIKNLDQPVKYAINNDLQKSLYKCYLLLGRAYLDVSQPELALHFMQLAKSITIPPPPPKSYYEDKKVIELKSVDNPVIKTAPSYYFDMGEIHFLLQEYHISNSFYIQFKNVVKDPFKVSEAQYKIADNFYALNKYEKAKLVYDTLLLFEKEQQRKDKIQFCYSRLAACEIYLNNTAKGLSYFRLSQSVTKNSNTQNTQNSINTKIVTKALRDQEQYSEELSIRNEVAENAFDQLEYLELAQTYFRIDDFNNAEKNLDLFFEDLSYKIYEVEQIQVVRNMANKLNKEGESKKAVLYLEYYNELYDSVLFNRNQLELSSKSIGASGFENIAQLELLKKDKEISETTINHLVEQSKLQSDLVSFQRVMIFLLGGFIVLGLFAIVYITRVSRQRRIANQQLALRSLRSQMNPHFIFNALNSVNSFISGNDDRSANRFLTEFSTLMRSVMSNSEHEFISLAKEIEIIKIYLELEHFRFENKFDYQFKVNEAIEEEDYLIPPMIIQPYIENAIWHGLRYKEDKGTLDVSIKLKGKNLEIIIADDGIGRVKSKELKTKNQKKTKSTALRNINESIKLFNELHNIKITTETKDLHEDGTGTVVTLIVPQPKNG